MTQTTNSLPPHPTIVFEVDLNTVNRFSHLTPEQHQNSPDKGRVDTDSLKDTRSTFIPGLLGGENGEFAHGEQFTLYGARAHYYRQEIAKGNFPMLKIISQS